MLKQIAKFIKILNSEADPNQIALALCLAMIAGLTPLSSPHNILVLLLVLVLRVNLASFILGLGIFSGFAWIFDGSFHKLGLNLLQQPGLEQLWTNMYNSDFWILSGFNNTVLLGSLIVSLILFIPLYALSLYLIKKYRERVVAWAKKTKFMQIMKGTKIYKAYQALSHGGPL